MNNINNVMSSKNNYLTNSSELMRKFIAKQSEFIIKTNEKSRVKSANEKPQPKSSNERIKISELLSFCK